MANTKFTKGQTVFMITAWDQKGTFAYSKHIVGSCGAKRLHLLDEAGNTLEARLYPEQLNQMTNGACTFVFANEEGFNPEAKAIELASQAVEVYMAHYQDMIERNKGNESYVKATIKDLESVHEPIALNRCK